MDIRGRWVFRGIASCGVALALVAGAGPALAVGSAAVHNIDKVDAQTGKVTASYTCDEGSKAKFLMVFARNKAAKEEDFRFAKVTCDGTKRSVTVTTEHVIEKDEVYLFAQLVEAVATEPGLTKKVGTKAELYY